MRRKDGVMKSFLIVLGLFINASVFAASNTDMSTCKALALEEAYNEYTARYGESMIFTKLKYRPIIEGDSVTFLVQIIDSDRHNGEIITVAMNKNNCRILSLD